jgi:RimJ/RimL family protein N-acetyltransferase
MNIATLDDFDVIKSTFTPHQKTYFPHIRTDYIERKIKSGNVIYENGVVIIFGVYKRKQKIGNQQAEKGDAHIGQIVVQQQGNGNATKILKKFFDEMNTKVWLTVRSENTRARAFYEKNGMKNVGDTSWSNGTIPGTIYLYTN